MKKANIILKNKKLKKENRKLLEIVKSLTWACETNLKRIDELEK